MRGPFVAVGWKGGAWHFLALGSTPAKARAGARRKGYHHPEIVYRGHDADNVPCLCFLRSEEGEKGGDPPVRDYDEALAVNGHVLGALTLETST